MAPTPAQARAGVLRSWAHTPDRAARTAKAREAWHARFETQVDPDGVLTAEERAKRADFAYRAFMSEMSSKAAAARRAKSAGATQPAPGDVARTASPGAPSREVA